MPHEPGKPRLGPFLGQCVGIVIIASRTVYRMGEICVLSLAWLASALLILLFTGSLVALMGLIASYLIEFYSFVISKF